MNHLTKKLKFVCAVVLLFILAVWGFVYPLHLAVGSHISSASHSSRVAQDNACCSHHGFEHKDTNKPNIEVSFNAGGFCGICSMAAQFFTNGLAPHLDAEPVQFITADQVLFQPLASCKDLPTHQPRAPPAELLIF